MTQPSTSLRPVKPHLVLSHGRTMTTSLVVAKHFGKRHDNVLRDIDRLLGACSAEFHRLNFEEMSVMSNRGNGAQVEDRGFRMTRDGFSMLVMGFTGAKAVKWREAYIDAFNRMEQALRARAVVPVVQPVTSKLQEPATGGMDRLGLPLMLLLGFGLSRAETAVMWAILQTAQPDRPSAGLTAMGIVDGCNGFVGRSAIYLAIDKLVASGLIEPHDDSRNRRGFWVNYAGLGNVLAMGLRLIEELAQLPTLPAALRSLIESRMDDSRLLTMARTEQTLRELLRLGSSLSLVNSDNKKLH